GRLPVAVEAVDLPPLHLESRHGEDLENLADGGEMIGKRRGVFIEIDEDPAVPHFAAHGQKAARRLVEIAEIMLLRHADEATLQVIAPGVIAADQQVLTSILLHERRAAMAAGIVEGADLVVRSAHDDDGEAEALEQLVAAGLRNLVRMDGAQPGLLPEML